MQTILNNLETILLVVVAFLGAFLAALWVSLVIWTFRDARSRSRDPFAHMLAALMVAVFGPLGMFIYLILRPHETLAEAYERSLEEEALLQDIEERLVCPGCKHTVQDDFQFCPSCHTRLKKVCPGCGALMRLRWNICPYCGTSPSAPHMAHEAPLVTEVQVSEPEPEPEPELEAAWDVTPASEPRSPTRNETMHPIGVMTGLENAVQTDAE
jgi:RNA polymerase subunit RPABC4/transcription elongation factor Spt4